MHRLGASPSASGHRPDLRSGAVERVHLQRLDGGRLLCIAGRDDTRNGIAGHGAHHQGTGRKTDGAGSIQSGFCPRRRKLFAHGDVWKRSGTGTWRRFWPMQLQSRTRRTDAVSSVLRGAVGNWQSGWCKQSSRTDMFARHSLVWLSERGWKTARESLPQSFHAPLDQWRRADWPAIVHRADIDMPDQHVCLGVALPPDSKDGSKMRIPLRAPISDVIKSLPPLSVKDGESIATPAGFEPAGRWATRKRRQAGNGLMTCYRVKVGEVRLRGRTARA
jgi:hypothetical protein